MSALLVCSMGMRLGPVVVTISSCTPRSLARSLARSTSEPVGCILSSVMPKGGMAVSIATRIFPAFLISSSVSACTDRPNDGTRAAPATRRSRVRFFMIFLLVQNDVRQISAELLLVDGVQSAVLELRRHPLVHFFEQPRLVLLNADGELEGVEHKLDLDLARWILLVELADQHLGGREDINLARQEGLPLGRVVLIADQLHTLRRFFGELGGVGRAAHGGNCLAVEIGQALHVNALRGRDNGAQNRVGLRKANHLGALRRPREGGGDQLGLAGSTRGGA